MSARAIAAAILMASAAVACGGEALPDPEPAITMPAGAISLPWRLAREDADRLIIVVMNGGCHRFREVRASEGPGYVQVAAIARDLRGRACSEDLEFTLAEVALDDALGPRALVPAPVDEGWISPALDETWPSEEQMRARADEDYP